MTNKTIRNIMEGVKKLLAKFITHKKKPIPRIWAVIIIAAIVCFVGTWLFWQLGLMSVDQMKWGQDKVIDLNVNNDSSKTYFSSKLIDLSFFYPASWGEADESLVCADNKSNDYRGCAYNILFSKSIGYVMAGGRSVDFSAPRGAYEIDQARGFKGKTAQEVCDNATASGLGSISFCEPINDRVIYAVEIPDYGSVCPASPGSPLFGINIMVISDTPDSKVAGFMLKQNILPQRISEMLDSMGSLCSKGTSVRSAYDSYVKELLNIFQTGQLDRLDRGTREKLNDFENLLYSLEYQDNFLNFDISDWNVCKSGQYGFEFKYPKEWGDCTTTDNKIKILTDYKPHNVYSALTIKQSSVKEFLEKKDFGFNFINTDSVQAFQVASGGGSGYYYVFLKDDKKVYKFLWDIESDQQPPKNLDGIWEPDSNTTGPQPLDIMRTIRPITAEADIDTSDWQTYKNEEYGFEFKYPKDFYTYLNQDAPVFVEFERVKVLFEMRDVPKNKLLVNGGASHSADGMRIVFYVQPVDKSGQHHNSGTSYQEMIDLCDKGAETGKCDTEIINVNGQRALLIKNRMTLGSGFPSLYFIAGQKLYAAELFYSVSDLDQELQSRTEESYENIFYNFIKTLKFN